MARKKKDEPAQTEPAKSEEVKAMISAGKLKKLLGAHRAAIRDASQIASALGSEPQASPRRTTICISAPSNSPPSSTRWSRKKPSAISWITSNIITTSAG